MTHTFKFILALLLLVGCQNEVLISPDDNRPNPDGSIGFRLRIEDSPINENTPLTKGTPHEGLDEKYDSVCVNIYSHTSDYVNPPTDDVKFFQKIRLEPGEPNWKSTPPVFWPAGKKLSFFAYASDIPFIDGGISFFPTSGVPDSIVYKVPEDVTKQPDLFVSTKLNEPQVDNVSLTMKHALACVSFSGIAPERGTYVKSITLRNVYGEGTLGLNDPLITWKVKPDSKGLTVFEAGIKDDQELGEDPLPDNNYLMTDSGYLMMIPQKLKDAAIDVLYWNKKDDMENKLVTYILPVDNESYATWRPGLKYVYKFGSQSADDITVAYYEKYADNEYGLFYNEKGAAQSDLDDEKAIVEAGYGVLAKDSLVDKTANIRLVTPLSTPVVSGTVVKLGEKSFLYPVNQSGEKTLPLSASSIPVEVYFNNSDKPCGMIVPHFAKGVYTVKTQMKDHYIRTPQQMRNITQLSRSSARGFHTYTQELDLDFSKTTIGGELLATSVVHCEFNDVFLGQKKRIENVKISATNVNGALFYSNFGDIKEVCLLNSSISSGGNTGGIAATNESGGVIYHPRIIGENDSDKKFEVQGSSGYVGAIAGLNNGTITGNNIDEEAATELPVAEVSGWVSIKGESQPVGGITGQNQGTITTCLVNGVHVTGPILGNVEIAKITIEGGSYVGGIVGVNRKMIIGNYSAKGDAAPDLAGLVSITGTGDFVGGIAGENSGTLNQVNVRLGRGKDATEATTITGKQSVGGIVGHNNCGTLKADGISNSFISVRGNVIVTGTNNVGGIVGNNGSGDISNCFVFNFYSQKSPFVHYAPKIIGETNVGGIVGYAGTGTIKQCAIFSTVSGSNGVGDDVTNAVAEVKATASSAGGIVGRGTELNITQSFVLGNVKINGLNNSGGFVGENAGNAEITSIHIGNSGTEVINIYNDLFKIINLPVYDSRMKTNGGAMTETSGTPTIEGTTYVGGICGVNWGTVTEVSIKDNINIGTSSSSFVGGIAGGNGINANITDCKTYNPKDGNASVVITGNMQVGGIVGLNNGIVKACQLGLSSSEGGGSRPITIKGVSGLGGIVGTNGGHEDYIFDATKPKKGSGNDSTMIMSCNVYGKVLIAATGAGDRVGGIVGENGFTNRVIDCKVIGYTSSYTSTDDYSYDITLKGEPNIGGIAGINYGDIHGTSPSGCMVTHTAVVGNGHAGGLVGSIKSRKAKEDKGEHPYEAKLYNCDVSRGVLIHQWEASTGAFVGQMDGVGASATNQTLYGTALGGVNNRIYIGTSDPVRISKNNSDIMRPPKIEELPVYGPQEPPAESIPLPVPAKRGNLWADYQMWNYLYYEAY